MQLESQPLSFVRPQYCITLSFFTYELCCEILGSSGNFLLILINTFVHKKNRS